MPLRREEKGFAVAIYQCKQCGGALNPSETRGIAICDSCGSRQTIPTDIDEKISALFIRANDLRRKNEFDKASSIYSLILEEVPNNAEAYWGLLLCEFGIEYVVDDRTGVHIPTCHRLTTDSLFDNTNYVLALRYADIVAGEMYKKDGVILEELRRKVAEKSRRAEPVDVFICYKESDGRGERTIDSVWAQKIYRRLINEGYKVFYARETLKQHPGEEYEPYIFSALHSAKVMLVITTDLSYLNSVWVRNEWSRYMALMKAMPNEKRRLVPCVSQLSIDDLPMEFLAYEGIELDKIGAEEDLVLGLEKYLDKVQGTKEPISKVGDIAPTIPTMLARGKQCLDFGDWNRAQECYQRVLDIDLKCTEAFLGLILAENKMGDRVELAQYLKANHNSPIFDNPNFKIGIYKYADGDLRDWVEEVIQQRNRTLTRIEQEKEAARRLCCVLKAIIRSRIEQEKEEARRRDKEKERIHNEREAAIKRAKLKTDEELNAWEEAYVCAALTQKTLILTPSSLTVKRGNSEHLSVYHYDFLASDCTAVDNPISIVMGHLTDKFGSVVRLSKSGELTCDNFRVDDRNYTTVKVLGEQIFALGVDQRLYVFQRLKKKQFSKSNVCDTLDAQVGKQYVKDFWVGASAIAIRMSDDKTYVQIKGKSQWDDVGCVCEVAIGETFVVALQPYGKLKVISGTLSTEFEAWQSEIFVSIKAGRQYLLGLTIDGRVLVRGENTCAQVDVNDWMRCVAIAAEENYFVAITSEQQLFSTNKSVLKAFNAVHDLCVTAEEGFKISRMELRNIYLEVVSRIQKMIGQCESLKRGTVSIKIVREMQTEIEAAHYWVTKEN